MEVLPAQLKEEEKHLDELEERFTRLHAVLEKLSDVMERVNFSAYVELLHNPRKVFILNFLFGIARGFGMALGMTLLFTLFVYGLSYLVDLPLVGKYIALIVKMVQDELKK